MFVDESSKEVVWWMGWEEFSIYKKLVIRADIILALRNPEKFYFPIYW